MKKTRRPVTISDQDLAVLARFAQSEEWKVLRRLRQVTIYNLIQKEFKFPTTDPVAMAINKSWNQGAVFALKSETTQIEDAPAQLEKRQNP